MGWFEEVLDSYLHLTSLDGVVNKRLFGVPTMSAGSCLHSIAPCAGDPSRVAVGLEHNVVRMVSGFLSKWPVESED